MLQRKLTDGQAVLQENLSPQKRSALTPQLVCIDQNLATSKVSHGRTMQSVIQSQRRLRRCRKRQLGNLIDIDSMGFMRNDHSHVTRRLRSPLDQPLF